MSMDMVMGLAFLDGALRAVGLAREVLVVIGGIVLKTGNKRTTEQWNERTGSGIGSWTSEGLGSGKMGHGFAHGVQSRGR
jgi:hypothetical protein